MGTKQVRGLVTAMVVAVLMVPFLGVGQAGAVTPSGALWDWTRNHRLVSSDAAFARASTRGIWLYGDSITTRDYPDLQARLASSANGSLTTAVDATPGIPTTPALDRLEARVAAQGSPEVLVMATGSNDIFAANAMATQVHRARRIVGPQTRIVWVDVWVRRTSKSALVQTWDARNTWRVNLLISRGPVDAVVPWNAFLAAKPTRPAAYLSDGVHTTVAGRAARNALITKSVVAAFRS